MNIHRHPEALAAPVAAPAPRRFVFVLLDQFTLLPFVGAVETLRVANRMAGRPLYAWSLAAESETVTSSAGITFRVDHGLQEAGRDCTIVVCGGLGVAQATSPRLLGWLRREARRGASVGGLCTGGWALARAGLLDGRRATIHWENHDGFAEEFAEVTLTKSLFVSEGRHFTAAGGTSAIDLMLKFIGDEHGHELAGQVADQLLHTTVRTERDAHRLSVPARIGVRHPRLSEVVQRMEATLDEPVSPATLAREVGLSTRQLERLFRRYLGRSPKRHYMELRLQKARNLLTQTEMGVLEVALACGFASSSHFSKCYRAEFHASPYGARGSRLSV